MIVLDTNVVSELLRPRPEPGVVEWVDQQGAGDLAITSVTAGELLYGVTRLPEGRRRDQLTEAVLAVVEVDFADRVLPFDVRAAEHFALVAADREAAGRPISTADGQIAATCLARGAVLATRNVRDFVGVGLELIDPWTQG